MRLLFLILVAAAVALGLFSYAEPARFARITGVIAAQLHGAASAAVRTVEIPRRNGGDFAVRAKINGISAPMVVDTGATSVVLTHETARAIGLPLEMLTYNIDVETVSGRTRAARVTLDQLGIGGLVERAVPALVVPAGQMKANLLGMSFLDRLESWEVRADRVKLRGYP